MIYRKNYRYLVIESQRLLGSSTRATPIGVANIFPSEDKEKVKQFMRGYSEVFELQKANLHKLNTSSAYPLRQPPRLPFVRKYNNHVDGIDDSLSPSQRRFLYLLIYTVNTQLNFIKTAFRNHIICTKI